MDPTHNTSSSMMSICSVFSSSNPSSTDLQNYTAILKHFITIRESQNAKEIGNSLQEISKIMSCYTDDARMLDKIFRTLAHPDCKDRANEILYSTFEKSFAIEYADLNVLIKLM